MNSLAGQVVLISGASAGIGEAIVRTLAAERMKLALLARSEENLRALAKTLEAHDVEVLTLPADVGDVKQLQAAVSRVIQHWGQLDVLINNAGMEAFHPFETLPLEQIQQTVQVNLIGAMQLTRLVIPHMLTGQGGHILNMSSTAGKFGPAFGAAYGATKAGLIAFTQSLRSEYYKRGIRATVLCPGFTKQGGIYERMKAAVGRGTPPLMGHTSTEAITQAVLKSLRTAPPEVLLNWPPMRPINVIAAMFPGLGEYLVRKFSRKWLEHAARANASRPTQRRAA